MQDIGTKVDRNFLSRGNFIESFGAYNTGKEISTESINAVARRSPPLYQGDIESVPLSGETFECLLLVRV